MFFAVSVADFGPVPPGKILLNGPWALLENFGQLTGFGSILIAAIFGPAILRDFQQDTYALIFTKPVTKFRLPRRQVAGVVCGNGVCVQRIAGGRNHRDVHAVGRQDEVGARAPDGISHAVF